MGRFKTLMILAALGAACPSSFGAITDGAGPPANDVATTPSAKAPAARPPRPEPPEPPRKYLEAGARLFNKRRVELAKKYLDAAEMYRDRLTPKEQIVLDVYWEHYEEYLRSLKHPLASTPIPAPTSPPSKALAAARKDQDAGVVTTSTVQAPPEGTSTVRAAAAPSIGRGPAYSGDASGFDPLPDGRAATPDDGPRGPTRGNGAAGLRDTADTKQKARWMLAQAREQIHKKQFDAAERTVAVVREMGVSWGFFDETPDKVAEALAKARARSGKSPVGGKSADLPHDRRSAKALLREARAALASGDVASAESVAREVGSWDVRFGPFDDTPEKVASAAGEVRRREAVRNAGDVMRTYLGPRGDRPNSPVPGQVVP